MNLEVFFAAPIVVQVHALTALAAFSLGVVQFMRPKGTLPHRVFGWTFLILMTVVAGTALFIRDVNDGGFSLIHLFVPLTAWGVIGGLVHARRGQIKQHRNAMFGMFIGALVIAGLFTFMPGRLMHAVIFG